MVFAFGFEGLGLETLRDHMSSACTSVESIINGICVLGKGLVLPSGDAGVNLLDDALMTTYRVSEAQTGAWGLFLSLLWGGAVGAACGPESHEARGDGQPLGSALGYLARRTPRPKEPRPGHRRGLPRLAQSYKLDHERQA